MRAFDFWYIYILEHYRKYKTEKIHGNSSIECTLNKISLIPQNAPHTQPKWKSETVKNESLWFSWKWKENHTQIILCAVSFDFSILNASFQVYWLDLRKFVENMHVIAHNLIIIIIFQLLLRNRNILNSVKLTFLLWSFWKRW